MARACGMAWHAPYMDLGVLMDSFRVMILVACIIFMLACMYRAHAHRFWHRQERAVPGDAGDAGLGRSDPPCAWQSDRRMPWACHDTKIRKIQTLFHENEHAFACTGLAAHASRGCRITYIGINHRNHDIICTIVPITMTVHRLRTRVVF